MKIQPMCGYFAKHLRKIHESSYISAILKKMAFIKEKYINTAKTANIRRKSSIVLKILTLVSLNFTLNSHNLLSIVFDNNLSCVINFLKIVEAATAHSWNFH